MTLEERLARLEARVAITELLARYCFAVDARDIAAMTECFTHDGSFRSIDGTMNAMGRDAVIEQFHTRFAALGPSNHFTHDHLITFDESDATRATGLVNAHAEVVRNDAAMWSSLRYHDVYRLESGRWRFQVRALEFFYYLKPSDYAEAMLGTSRNHANRTPHAADYPEPLATWRAYYAERPRGV
jgi:ketosteroid isomerase-like protein